MHGRQVAGALTSWFSCSACSSAAAGVSAKAQPSETHFCTAGQVGPWKNVVHNQRPRPKGCQPASKGRNPKFDSTRWALRCIGTFWPGGPACVYPGAWPYWRRSCRYRSHTVRAAERAMKGAHASRLLTVSTSRTSIALVCRELLCRLFRCPRHPKAALKPNQVCWFKARALATSTAPPMASPSALRTTRSCRPTASHSRPAC